MESTLCVLVDKHLCWDKQIDNISKKASEGIGMLRHVKPYVSAETPKHLCRALVKPHGVTFANIQEASYRNSKTELQEFIKSDSYEIRSIDVLKKLNWKTLGERRKEQQLKNVSKTLTCQCPENISDMFY